MAEIITVICPTCESRIKYVQGDPPRRCISCTTEVEKKNEASKMRLRGATVIEGKPLPIKGTPKGDS